MEWSFEFYRFAPFEDSSLYERKLSLAASKKPNKGTEV